MSLFKVNTGLREQEVCGLKWADEVEVPELNTSVFIIEGDKVKNGQDRLVVLNRVARSVIDSVRGRRELKLIAGLTDERSFAVLARAKQLDKEVTVDIPDASKRRLCAKRAQLTTAEKLSAELQTEDERVTGERRAATARMRLALSEGERTRILEYLAKYSALTVTPPDYATGLRVNASSPCSRCTSHDV